MKKIIFFLVLSVIAVQSVAFGLGGYYPFGDLHWKNPVASVSSLPATSNLIGDVRVETTGNGMYLWTGASTWIEVGSTITNGNSVGIPVLDVGGSVTQAAMFNSGANSPNTALTVFVNQATNAALSIPTIPSGGSTLVVDGGNTTQSTFFNSSANLANTNLTIVTNQSADSNLNIGAIGSGGSTMVLDSDGIGRVITFSSSGNAANTHLNVLTNQLVNAPLSIPIITVGGSTMVVDAGQTSLSTKFDSTGNSANSFLRVVTAQTANANLNIPNVVTGDTVLTVVATQNVQNKRIQKVLNIATAANSLTPNWANDVERITLASGTAFTLNAHTGTPTGYQTEEICVVALAGGAITYTFNGEYVFSTQAPLSSCTGAASKEDCFSLQWDGGRGKTLVQGYNCGM